MQNDPALPVFAIIPGIASTSAGITKSSTSKRFQRLFAASQ